VTAEQTANRQDAMDAKKNELAADVDDIAHRVIGAAIEVHRHLGPGYLESIYEEALCRELEIRGIPFRRQAPVSVMYKDRLVGEGRIDILVAEALVVELKTVDSLAPIHTAQVISYMKALGLHLGILINFNTPVLKDGLKRVVLS
jgi:GxxExxY protein